MSGPARAHAKAERAMPRSAPAPLRKVKQHRRQSISSRVEEAGVPFNFERLAVEGGSGKTIQAKLVVRQSDDLWEQEADRNADAVARALDGEAGLGRLSFTPVAGGGISDAGSASVQRQVEEEEEELLQAKRATGTARRVTTGTAVDIQAIRGGGGRLPADLRSELESRFGHDFGSVRVHSGSKAADLAGRIGARAFTTGHDVVFGGGEYRPETSEGKRLLAHELTHVVQQTGSGASRIEGQLQRKTAAAPVTPRKALKTALKGDDDDVRELTQSKVWPGLNVNASESATLMEHLLDGATLDEDEQAGIKVLSKARLQNRVDDTLEELGSRSRFPQLLDDYHGAEYRDLLSLLSNAIKKRKVKALYLDTFIAMWWLNKTEEEAVVVLLEKSSGADIAALLGASNRLAELRSDVDDPALAKRLEKKIGDGNAAEFDTVIKSLMAIFRLKARKAVGTKTMSGARLKQIDVQRLLNAAAKDLGTELTHYKAEVAAAVDKGDAAAVRTINKSVKARIAELLKENNVKAHEFDLELKWNKEFNRALDRSFARNWTKADLDTFDKHLGKIPPQLVYGNKNLREFRRATTDPKNPSYAGLAGATKITLFKALDRGVTTHEVGHLIHKDAPKILAAFGELSKWSWLTAAKLKKMVNKEGLPNDLGAKLDQHRKDKSVNAFVKQSGFNYRWARYGKAKEYWRYLANAGFVSQYARTNPREDFAETFEAYLVTPEKKRSKAPKKFEFMHHEIFVKYWLRKEKKRILDEFMDIGAGLEDKVKDGRLRAVVWKHGGFPVKQSLGKRLDDLATKRYSKVVKEAPRKHIPLKKWTEAWKVGEGYFEVLRKVYTFGAELSNAFEKFKADTRFRKKAIRGDLGVVYAELVDDLERAIVKRFGKLVEKPRRPLLAGKEVKPKPWPALAVAIKESKAALAVTDGYAPYLQRHETARQDLKFSFGSMRSLDLIRSLDPRGDFDPFAMKLLGKFPVGSVKHTILVAAIQSERSDSKKEFDRQKAKLMELVQKGKKYRRGVLVEPKVLVARYRSKVRRRFNRVKHRKSTTKPKGKRPQWF